MNEFWAAAIYDITRNIHSFIVVMMRHSAL